jgi:hypothetical protein
MNVAGVATRRMYFWATQHKQACRAISWAAGRGRPPQAAARRAGLEGCREKSPSSRNSTDTTERNTGMLRPRPAPVASLVELATGPSAVAGNVRPLGVRAEAGDAQAGSFV